MSDSHVSDEEADLLLPEFDATSDDAEAPEIDDDLGEALYLTEDDADPFDDSIADDVPIEYTLMTDNEEPSALNDDAVGLHAQDGDDGVAIAEDSTSMLDVGRGHAEEGLDFVGDDELGIDPIPREIDDGGQEGVADPAGSHIDENEFPPLDGDEEDEDAEELDIGIEIGPPPTSGDED